MFHTCKTIHTRITHSHRNLLRKKHEIERICMCERESFNKYSVRVGKEIIELVVLSRPSTNSRAISALPQGPLFWPLFLVFFFFNTHSSSTRERNEILFENILYIPAKTGEQQEWCSVRCVCILCCLKKEVEEKEDSKEMERENKKDPTLHAGWWRFSSLVCS